MSRPERRRPKRWTEVEDNILYNEARDQQVTTGQIKDWNRIAAKLPERTNKDCRKRWVNKVCGSLKKGPWEADEDQRLRNAVGLHGEKWTVVADLVGLRSPDQCAKRWQHSLDPRLEHRGWTVEEDERLLGLVQKHGREWKFIKDQEFPTRSRNNLKNRFTILSKRPNLGGKSTNNENNSSVSSGSPSAEETTPGADQELPGMEQQQQQCEETNNGQAMLLDVWGASTVGDWLEHLPAPSCDSQPPAISPAGKDTTSSRAATKASFEPGESSEPIYDLSLPSQLMSPAVELSNDYDHFKINPDNSKWTKSNENMLTVHDDPMALLGNHMISSSSENPVIGPQHELVGKVSLVIDDCDKDTLQHLVNMLRGLKGKAKLEIDA